MMKKIYVYGLIGFLISGQAALSINVLGYSSEVLADRITTMRIQQNKFSDNRTSGKKKIEELPKTDKKVEVRQAPQDSHNVEITYKYEKKKNFANIENNVAIMNQDDNHIIGSGNEIESQAAKIAKVLSGKLLIASD